MLLAFTICGCQGRAVNNEKVATVSVANQTSDADAIATRVQEIYTTVFKVYNEEDSLRNLDIQMENGVFEQRDKFNKDFCSKEWNTLLAKVNEIDSLYHSDELGFWDADYWIMGQDWHKLSISDVQVLEMSSSVATVKFLLHNFDSEDPVSLRLVNEDGIWKIDDFLNGEYDLDWKRAMQEYVAEETKNKN